tara:strand:- start:310 stop:747 length:438 start_codon:yes stop_codon:yes gene_type:complete
MARRRSRKTRTRRRKSGVSLIGVAETVMLANAATQTLFNTNAYNFVAGGSGFGAGNEITLRELFDPKQAVALQASNPMTGSGGGMQMAGTFSVIQSNLKSNWITGAAQMVLIPIGFKAVRSIGSPAIRKMNALLRKTGIASTVKV